MIFNRQRHLLRLLESLGGGTGNLDFQKLLFLYCQELAGDAPYSFVPYKFGAFSFTCYADRRKLVERGLIEADERRWQLTAEGVREAACSSIPIPSGFVSKWRGWRGDRLVAETYRRFPWTATNSEIASRLLAGEPEVLEAIRQAGVVPHAPAVITIGYEGHTLESYLNRLLREGVTILCDVRKNPLSRKYGFSKGTLSNGCGGVGIRYEHLPELGIASELRRELESQEDYDRLFDEYEETHLPLQGAAISKITGWVRDGARVALTCYEHLPQQCHRHCVAESVHSHAGVRTGLIHL